MVDMNALERQLADESLRIVGRARPVDDLAVYEAVSRSRRWGFTMFSALKLITAGVIVALFGGFLLAGVLTTQQGDEMVPAAVTESPSPVTAEELLSGMVTEEVEPGVFRVTNDGVRDLMQAFGVYIGDDGSVWGAQMDGVFRLGGEFVEWPTESPEAIRVAPDGTVWAGLRSYDGHRWTEHEAPPGATDDDYFRVSHLDGTTWTTWPDPQGSGRWIVARRDGDQWAALDTPFVPFVPPGQEVAWVDLRATDDGSIWAETAFEYSRWTDGEWQRVFVSGGPSDQIAFDMLVDLTPDGSIWVHRMETPYEEEGIWIREVLRFFDGSEWLEWADEDWASFGSGELQVVGTGPDGSLWSTTGRGILRFDRERWSHYLPDLQVGGRGAVGPDGSVWVLAEPAEASESWFEDDDPWYDLYVITLEAVAATEAVPMERPPAEEPTVVAETATTTQELLASMRVDEASPGFFRVDHDGVRSLSSTEALRIVAGHDGGIRLLDDDGFFRLGSEETHEWPTPMPYGFAPNTNQVLEVAPDRTMWIIPVWSEVRPDMRHGSALRSTDGEEWTVQPCPGESDCQGVSVAPDGTVWASWREGPADGDGRVYLGQFGPTGWQLLDGDPPYEFSRMAFTDAGDLYGISAGWHAPLNRYVDGVWREERFADALVDVGPDGTVWQDAGSCIVRPPGPCGQDGLVRHTGGERMGWTSAELPGIALGFGHDREFQVAPDGSVWFSRWRSADGTDSGGDELWRESVFMGSESDLDESEPLACDGLARFDGETLMSWLPATCISMDVAADGSVWVLAGDEEGKDLYVITPEAVAATES